MNHLTLGERQKLAELRRKMQKAPSLTEEFISRMKKEVKDAHIERIERGIAYLLAALALGFIVYALREVRFAGLPEEVVNFLGWLWRVPAW